MRVVMVSQLSLLLVITLFSGVLCAKPHVRFCCTGTEDCDNSDNFTIYHLPGVSSFKANYEILEGKPCEKMYRLEPESYEDDSWSFIEVCCCELYKRFLC